jgi:hypothetical protein
VILIGRTIKKIEQVVAEFQAQGIVTREDHIMMKNMDFNEPTSVEKDFQNVGPLSRP